VEFIEWAQRRDADLIVASYWSMDVLNEAQQESQGKQMTIFISPERHDASSIRADLHIDCKLRTELLPAPTVSAFLFLPFYSLSFSQRHVHSPTDLWAAKTMAPRSRFCAFLAKNCVRERLQFVEALSHFQPVDALGECQPNGTIDASEGIRGFETLAGATYLDRAVQAYMDYRFVICLENGREPGYVTEKIVNAFLAGAIPIYVGAPDVAVHFNERAFINCNDMSWEDCASLVQSIDQDEDAIRSILAEPPIAPGSIPTSLSWHPQVRTPSAISPVAQAFRASLSHAGLNVEVDPGWDVGATGHVIQDRTMTFRPRWGHALEPLQLAIQALGKNTSGQLSCPTPFHEAQVFGSACLVEASCEIQAPRRLQGPVTVGGACAVLMGDFSAYTHVSGRLWPTEAAALKAPNAGSSSRDSGFQRTPRIQLVPQSLLPDLNKARILELGIDSLAVVLEDALLHSGLKIEQQPGVPVFTISSIDALWLGDEALKGDVRLDISFRPKIQETEKAIRELAAHCRGTHAQAPAADAEQQGANFSAG